MPVKTRKPTRRNRRDTHRNRHSARSQALRSLGVADNTVRENPTVSSVKRGVATARISSLHKTGVLSPQRQSLPPIIPQPQVIVTTDAWYDLLIQNSDLCYLSLSGQFNRQNGFVIKTADGAVSIADAFRVLSPNDSFQGGYAISNESRIAYSRQFADPKTQAVIDAAIQKGKRVTASLPIDHYYGLIPDNNASAMDYGFPYGSSFSEAITYILNKNEISSSMFMDQTHLDYNIYSKLKNNPTYIPERDTCKAILFAVRPSIKKATDLFHLAKHEFTDNLDDRLLLALFANQDYDINRYNNLMIKIGHPTLGSKQRKKTFRRQR